MISEISKWLNSFQTESEESEEPVRFTKIFSLEDEIPRMSAYIPQVLDQVLDILRLSSMKTGLCYTLVECQPMVVPIYSMGLKITIEVTKVHKLDLQPMEFMAANIKRQLRALKYRNYGEEYSINIAFHESMNFDPLFEADVIAVQTLQKMINDDHRSLFNREFKIVRLGQAEDRVKVYRMGQEEDNSEFKAFKIIIINFVFEKK